ncbi:MAG: endospore germination permease [Peptococcaceae bacterium]|nr:endospore germination permease [Peptococcaceae bacterium]
MGKINSRQAAMLMLTMIFATVILFVPGITAGHARQDAWLSIILATGAGLLVARLVTALGLRFPDQTIFEYAGEILGRWPGKLVGLLYIWWFLHMGAEVISEYGSFIVAAFMVDTPIIVFHLVVVAIAAYAVRNGLEVFTRANEIFLPLILGSVLVLFVLSTRDMDLHRLLPIFEAGAVNIVKGAVPPLSWFGEIASVAVLIPYLNQPRRAHLAAAAAVLACGAFFLLTVVGILAIYGPDLTGAWMFPTLNGARIISIANFLERLEPVIMGIWVTGGFVKISVFYWAAVLGSAQVLELKDYRPLVLPVGAVLVAMSILLHPSILELLRFLDQVWPPYALSVFEAGIPLLLLVTALVRGKGGSPR